MHYLLLTDSDIIPSLIRGFLACVSVLCQIVVLDIVLDDFLIHVVCVCRFRSGGCAASSKGEGI